jgi:hypothetical protein
MLNDVMLIVVGLNVVMLSVAAPFLQQLFINVHNKLDYLSLASRFSLV